MGWKNWSYWLRGGIIGGGLVIVYLTLIRISRYLLASDSDILAEIIVLSHILLEFPIIPIVENFRPLGELLSRNNVIISFLIIAIPWFIIGAIVGFIIGKIKQRKKKN